MAETAQFNTTTLIVDDTSNLIEYSAGWTAGFSGSGISDDVAEYMQTKHGASSAGRTAKFSFTGMFWITCFSQFMFLCSISNSSGITKGTSVAVYGSLGSVDVYGIPVSSYSVDGGNTATYTAPIIQPGGFQTHVAFYQSPVLPPGTHELVITNVNGTAPSVLWIDFILYDPSQSTGETGGGATTGGGTSSPSNEPASSPSSSPTSSPQSSAPSSSLSTTANASSKTLPISSGSPSIGLSIGPTSTSSLTPSASGSSTFGGPVAVGTEGASLLSPTKRTPTGAIVGGVIGGIVVLALLSVLLFLCYRRRRSQQINLHEPTTTTPFRA